MATDKHRAIYNWVAACPLLSDVPLFDFLSEHSGSVALAPVASDAWVKRYMRGGGTRQYSFEIQAMFAVSDTDDDTNMDNMGLMQSWMNWLQEQEAAQNFPNFGPGCGSYRILMPQGMPTQAMRYESGYAKYTFPATVQYDEDTLSSKQRRI